MNHAANPPTPAVGYADLDPDRVLRTLDALGLRGDGRLLQLNSYENRVFQVFLEDGNVVVAKFYRPGRWSDAQILEEHAFATELAADDVPVVAPRVLAAAADAPGLELIGAPPTLARWLDDGALHRVAVSERHAGRAPELEDPAAMQWLGRFLGRLHAVGARRPFAHRRTLDAATFGHAARQRLLDGGFVPDTELPAWTSWCDAALARVDRALATHAHVPRLRLHGDFHPGNIMWRAEGPHVVDLDDACNGPAVQDLWMLLSGEREAMRVQFGHVLRGYEDFAEFDDRERHLVEALRTLRLIHYSAWIGRRWDDPAFPAAFPWFNTARYWQDRILELREQIALMEEAPL